MARNHISDIGFFYFNSYFFDKTLEWVLKDKFHFLFVTPSLT